MEKSIKKYIEDCYKMAEVIDIFFVGYYLYLNCNIYKSGTSKKIIAKVFETFKDVEVIEFASNEVEGVYTNKKFEWLGKSVA